MMSAMAFRISLVFCFLVRPGSEKTFKYFWLSFEPMRAIWWGLIKYFMTGED